MFGVLKQPAQHRHEHAMSVCFFSVCAAGLDDAFEAMQSVPATQVDDAGGGATPAPAGRLGEALTLLSAGAGSQVSAGMCGSVSPRRGACTGSGCSLGRS